MTNLRKSRDRSLGRFVHRFRPCIFDEGHFTSTLRATRGTLRYGEMSRDPPVSITVEIPRPASRSTSVTDSPCSSGSPPVRQTCRVRCRPTSARRESIDRLLPGPNEYGVSHQEQRKLHRAVRMNVVRTPVSGPSPWSEWNTSMICTAVGRGVGGLKRLRWESRGGPVGKPLKYGGRVDARTWTPPGSVTGR